MNSQEFENKLCSVFLQLQDGLFMKGKIGITAKFRRTNLVI